MKKKVIEHLKSVITYKSEIYFKNIKKDSIEYKAIDKIKDTIESLISKSFRVNENTLGELNYVISIYQDNYVDTIQTKAQISIIKATPIDSCNYIATTGKIVLVLTIVVDMDENNQVKVLLTNSGRTNVGNYTLLDSEDSNHFILKEAAYIFTDTIENYEKFK